MKIFWQLNVRKIFQNTGASAAPLKKPAHTQTQTPARFQSQTLTRTSARKPQRTATKDIDHTYKDLPLGNRAFALRMKCLEQKRKKQQEKENAFKSKPAKYREKRCTKNKKNNPSSNSTCESSSNN